MTRTEAHNLLDDAQSGEFVTVKAITEALHATGDLARYEPEPVTYTSPQWTTQGGKKWLTLRTTSPETNARAIP